MFTALVVFLFFLNFVSLLIFAILWHFHLKVSTSKGKPKRKRKSSPNPISYRPF